MTEDRQQPTPETGAGLPVVVEALRHPSAAKLILCMVGDGPLVAELPRSIDPGGGAAEALLVNPEDGSTLREAVLFVWPDEHETLYRQVIADAASRLERR